MALNFPTNTDLPYVDPVSGLKYIYNDAVGAWETAILPPAIVSSSAPALTIPGFLWWDDISGRLFVYYKDTDSEQWVEAVPTSGDTVRRSWIGTTPTPTPIPGDMWWDSENGRLYIYYNDGSSSQWMDASPNGGGDSSTGGARIRVFQSDTAPPNPVLGDIWYNSTEQLSYYYNRDGAWVRANRDPDNAGVKSISAAAPIVVTSGENPTVSVANASATDRGAMRFANQTETNTGVETDAAVTPATLKGVIDNIAASFPSSTDTQKGAIETATQAEVEAGTDATRAVTPLSLKQGIAALGVAVPTGTVIQYAGATPPAGYIVCNGAVLSRSTYSALFAVIGTTYGIGDGATTFGVPTLTGTTLYCIKT